MGAPTGELARGLTFYNSRYDARVLARFTQPDTLVPNPGDPQSLNRYSYAGNNPLRYVDPSGHAPQYPGDPDPNNAPCSTGWCWQNRWYMARGYGWNGNGWGNKVGPVFYDQGALTEMAADAGISFVGNWMFGTGMKAVGTGIALFGRKLDGGLARLKELLGGGARIAHGAGVCLMTACSLPPGTSTIHLPENVLMDSSWATQTTIHELAHIIDWHSNIKVGHNEMGFEGQFGYASIAGNGTFSSAWSGAPLTDYAAGNEFRPYPRRWERWAEAVTTWVLGPNMGGLRKGVVDLSVQMNRIGNLLNGVY